MFWGLIMEPGRCYTQKVKVSFHVSMAALDISNSSDDPAQVMCVFEGRNYLLCTLNNKDKVQCPLDLNFEAGSKVSFATNGKAHVHLTGYLITEDEYFDEDIEEEEVLQVKEKKRTKKEEADGPPTKKSKTTKKIAVATTVEEEEDDESDSDFDVEGTIEHGEGEEEESEDEEEDEVEEEEEEDEKDEEETSSLSNEDAVDSEEEKTVKPKQNGVAKANAKQKQKPQEKVPKEKPKKQEKKEPQQKQKKTVLKGGIIIQDLKEGHGEPVKEGKLVHVYYEGRLKDNNKMFDSTTKGPGFSFRVGRGEVIKGWDIGLVGVKVGGKRRITCPPKVAYGQSGSPPVIPPNSTLVFDVEVKKIS